LLADPESEEEQDEDMHLKGGNVDTYHSDIPELGLEDREFEGWEDVETEDSEENSNDNSDDLGDEDL
jgi:hypothetical protein